MPAGLHFEQDLPFAARITRNCGTLLFSLWLWHTSEGLSKRGGLPTVLSQAVAGSVAADLNALCAPFKGGVPLVARNRPVHLLWEELMLHSPLVKGVVALREDDLAPMFLLLGRRGTLSIVQGFGWLIACDGSFHHLVENLLQLLLFRHNVRCDRLLTRRI